MFGSPVLDVVVGLVFVYLLLSIICTAVNEMIAGLFSLRARNLAKGISNLLSDKEVKGLDELFYDHPLIKGLYRGGTKPSYIPSHTFALAFLDGVAPAKGDVSTVMSEIRSAVSGLPNDSELRQVLLILLGQAGDDLVKLRAGIETWFDDAMARVSGWYKRKSQAIIFILALLVTGVTNMDTIQLARYLSSDPSVRAAVITQAESFSRQQPGTAIPQPAERPDPSGPASPGEGRNPPSTPAAPTATAGTANPQEAMAQVLLNLQQIRVPLGWQTAPRKEEWPGKIIGLLLTAFAVFMGAPFWFDTLNRIMRIRSTGTVPQKE